MSRLKALSIPENATLETALRCIEEGTHGIAFVCDRNGRVLGTLSDGDIRRALLRRKGLNSPAREAMNTAFTHVSPEVGRNEVLDLMRARVIAHVPVVDKRGKLVGLHVLREMLGRVDRPNCAVIMAGGRGVRLLPLTESVPKPMIHVAGRPILERLVLHVTSYGIKQIYISVNHLASAIESHFGDGSAFGCRIEYLREDEPLGTGGSLSLLPRRPKAPMLVMNGDLVTQVDIAHLLNFHEKGGYAATFGMRPYAVEVPFGVAKVRGNRLVALEEKPTQRMLINAGIYVLSPDTLKLVPRRTNYPITDLFGTLLERGQPVGGCLIRDEWTDIGRPQELQRARGDL